MRDLQNEERELRQQAAPKKSQIDQTNTQLASLESQAGQQNNKLRQHAPETAQAWEWIQKNQDLFENTIYGPPLVECSVKDPRYIDQVESLLQRSSFLAFTTQNTADYLKLQRALYQDLKLADIQINTASKPLSVARRHNMPSVSDEQLRSFGLDFWAIDLIDAPEPVLAMLCSVGRIHSTGIALKESTEEQFAMLVDSQISTFVTGQHHFNTTRRREYGPGAVSTMTKAIRRAQYWTDQPVDVAEKRQLQETVDSLTEEWKALGTRVKPLREKMLALRQEKTEVMAEVVCLCCFVVV